MQLKRSWPETAISGSYEPPREQRKMALMPRRFFHVRMFIRLRNQSSQRENERLSFPMSGAERADHPQSGWAI
ncbi:MAG TPA: hypothetical protein DEO58_11405 [Alphaproteobacteria bacterium]|nr:hypothetical protein [Alphaproteobacteria bacterium]